MASSELHFVLIPLMCPGHLIPMVDMARLLAQHGITISIITTPLNASRFNSIIIRDMESGLKIQVLEVPFQAKRVGLPEGCENLDTLPSRSLSWTNKFFHAIHLMQNPIEHLLQELKPSCIISDKYLPWTSNLASKFHIPRLLFDGTGCFAMMCTHNIGASKVHEGVPENEPFVVPGFPDRIELTRSQLPPALNPSSVVLKDEDEKRSSAEKEAYGIVVNTFEELEMGYVKELRKVKEDKVWCIGPLSLCNKKSLDKAQRGNKATMDQNECLIKWLDSWPSASVVYACLGTLNCLPPQQLMELGLGLEASKRPFVWVIREGNEAEELEKLMAKEGFEERTKERGLVIRGWAPQVLILSHQAVGGFLTHCGWNSTLEGVCTGLPMITFPLFAEQFYNERLVVDVLRIGVGVGAKGVVKWGEEKKGGELVKREEIEKAIGMVMDHGEGSEGKERRRRARELGEMANKALEEGGSSYLNIELLIEDIKNKVIENEANYIGAN